MVYAYIYFDPITLVPFYVGKGTGRRYKQHLNKCHNKFVNTKIKSLQSNGISPDIAVIETSTSDIALSLEKGLIKCIGRKVVKSGPLLNLDGGGLFSGAKKGRQAPNKGTKYSDERKQKMSDRMRGINAGVPVVKASCVFCHKSGGLPAMTRYHFENCKEKIN